MILKDFALQIQMWLQSNKHTYLDKSLTLLSLLKPKRL